MPRTSRPGSERRCFSSVEALIVVVALALLVAVAVPRLGSASETSQETLLRDVMRLLRTKLDSYHVEHHAKWPGLTGTTPDAHALMAELTSVTSADGGWDVSNPQAISGPFRLGPYLSEFPVNPVNHLATMKMVSSADSSCAALIDGTTGWIYSPFTGELLPNLVGSDSEGKLFAQY